MQGANKDLAWCVLFSMPNFWAVMESESEGKLKGLYKLQLVCHLFKENIPINLAVHTLYSSTLNSNTASSAGFWNAASLANYSNAAASEKRKKKNKGCMITKTEAIRMLGLTTYSLQHLRSPLHFMDAFNIAWARGFKFCLEHRQIMMGSASSSKQQQKKKRMRSVEPASAAEASIE